jgi:hypothetical protein
MARAVREAGDTLKETTSYRGDSEWLVLFGVGARVNDAARRAQVRRGQKVLMWDLGYFGRAKGVGYVRASINHDHPQALLDQAPDSIDRWGTHGIALREDATENGPIILVGLGSKSRSYLKVGEWEERTLKSLYERFPGRKVIHRPKPKHPYTKLSCERDEATPIADLLKGASLVVCRHSNVAVDATIAGVPFECEDGAAMWLKGKPYDRDNRLDFLRRLAWFQWKSTEAVQAWQFFKGIKL